MTRRRFYASPENFDTAADSVTLDADEARHLREVLRLRRGDEAFVFDGAGREFRCVVAESGKNAATLSLAETVKPAQPESPLHLTLAIALLKGEKFAWVVQKATELGVNRVVPVQTHNADVRLRDTRDAAHRTERWRRVALAATKQSGRACLTEIADCQMFSDFVRSVSNEISACFMFSERNGTGWPSAMQQCAAQPGAVIALVGAEGGWADEEIALANESGWRIVTLGGRILRAETAALVAATLLQHQFGDLR